MALKEDLKLFYKEHCISKYSSSIELPDYWVKVMFLCLKVISEEFPNIKFGSISCKNSRCKIYTVPTTPAIERMKYELYEQIDLLIQETVNKVLKP
jgi:hypothetical protein